MRQHGAVSFNKPECRYEILKKRTVFFLSALDTRSQFPLQQTLNSQFPQNIFTQAQQFQDPGGPFGVPRRPSLNQLSQTIGVTPLQHILPQRMSPNAPGFPMDEQLGSFGQTDLSPVRVNVPMMAPQKIPSFLTASQVYKDFEDVNSRSHMSDDIFGNQSKLFIKEFFLNYKVG